MILNFNIDEQIFLKNDKTEKVYTLTLNRSSKPIAYDVTREWTIPNQTQLASKTDRFTMFKQAAEFIEKQYRERIENGYAEIMRKQDVIKQSQKIETHKISEKPAKPNLTDSTVDRNKTSPGRLLENSIQKRLITGITDRIKFSNTKS